jgi:hypothetical protein
MRCDVMRCVFQRRALVVRLRAWASPHFWWFDLMWCVDDMIDGGKRLFLLPPFLFSLLVLLKILSGLPVSFSFWSGIWFGWQRPRICFFWCWCFSAVLKILSRFLQEIFRYYNPSTLLGFSKVSSSFRPHARSRSLMIHDSWLVSLKAPKLLSCLPSWPRSQVTAPLCFLSLPSQQQPRSPTPVPADVCAYIDRSVLLRSHYLLLPRDGLLLSSPKTFLGRGSCFVLGSGLFIFSLLTCPRVSKGRLFLCGTNWLTDCTSFLYNFIYILNDWLMICISILCSEWIWLCPPGNWMNLRKRKEEGLRETTSTLDSVDR